MIARYAGQTGAVYYEGRFKDGLPNGVLRVEQPGSRARLREFRAGKDVGSAAAGNWQPLTF